MQPKLMKCVLTLFCGIILIELSSADRPAKPSGSIIDNDVIDLDDEQPLTINKTTKDKKEHKKIVFDRHSNDIILSDDDDDGNNDEDDDDSDENDTDLTTGSGSGTEEEGNVTSAEKFTELVLSVSELGSKSDSEELANDTVDETTQKNEKTVPPTTTVPPLPMCKEIGEDRWSAWSIWMKNGNSDIRFRSCKTGDIGNANHSTCRGPRVETRPCRIRKMGKCASPFGKETEEYKQTCQGADLLDLHFAESIFNEKEIEKDCRFALYDAGLEKFVHKKWTVTDLKERGDKVLWCDHREIFLPFYSPYKLCEKQLEKYCKGKLSCKYNKRKTRSRGEYKHKCWKKFLLGYSMPTGFPNIDSEMYFICQKFAERSTPANVFGTKETYYGTIYNTADRLPLMSFGRFKDLGDDSAPVMTYMIEKGLQQNEYSFFDWLGTKKQRGMYHKEIPPQQTAMCEIGEYQAITYDFDSLKYEIHQLLPSMLMGHNVGKQISAYTLTNTAPMHLSLSGAWKRAVTNIRQFAINVCGISNEENKKVNNHHESHNTPEMYIISGAVPSTTPRITTGNDVNVPYLFWLAGCCVRGAETSSFSIYARNTNDSTIVAAPVAQLEVLLSDLYKKKKSQIKLFPSLEGVCGHIGNDKSETLYL